MQTPLIVGIGGTPNRESTTEQALVLALAEAEHNGAQTMLFGGAYLANLPLYLTPGSDGAGEEMVQAVRRADGVVLASPGYHGSMSGAVKNAIDYLEETAKDARPYLDGVPVGLIVTAYGWQATGSTLAAMRATVHALRGWPTPLGATINTSGGIFAQGKCLDDNVAAQIAIVGTQVATFSRSSRTSQTHAA